MPRNDLIQLRSDTAANWASVNPTLAVGETGFETDTGKFKIGTGSTAWTSLLYATDASDITGATLASNVTGSSLTSVGTLGSLAVTDDITRGGVSLPRGIMSFTSRTTADSTITGEEVQITGASFTAVANRYYKITYFEPSVLHNTGNTGNVVARIRLTNISGSVIQQSLSWVYSTYDDMSCVAITTLTAGTTNFVATLQSPSGTMTANRGSIQYAFLLVEDIGAV